MLDFARVAQQRNGLKKMNRPLNPFCNKGMYEVGSRNDPSSGEVETEYQCLCLNSHHKAYIREPIPGWKSKERKVEIAPNARRMTPKIRRKILVMLAQGISYPQIAKATSFSTAIICRMKQVTMLAAMAVAINRLR